MMRLAEWIAMHALLSWAIVLFIAVLSGDLAWKQNVRWHRRVNAAGREPAVMRWHVGLLLILVMAVLFAAIAFAVTAGQPDALVRFDTVLASRLHQHLSPALLGIVVWITYLGGTVFIAPVAALVALTLILRRRRQLAVVWVITMLGIIAISGGLKSLVQRVRPLHDHGFIVEHSWSFPSGHAFGSTVFYGMLGYLLLRKLPRRFHRAVIATSVLLIALVGTSRIVLQVHYFSDVLAGYASGAVWLLLCIGVAEHLHADSRRSSNNPPQVSAETHRE